MNPSTRGVWLDAASGQRLRHSPGAINNSSGSRGMTTFQKMNRPVFSATSSSAATVSPPRRLPTRSACHALTVRREGMFV